MKTKQPKKWEVVSATGGCTFVEKCNTRFAFYFDEGSAHQLAEYLNKKDAQIEKLKARK